jgi:hypothetical protein
MNKTRAEPGNQEVKSTWRHILSMEILIVFEKLFF